MKYIIGEIIFYGVALPKKNDCSLSLAGERISRIFVEKKIFYSFVFSADNTVCYFYFSCCFTIEIQRQQDFGFYLNQPFYSLNLFLLNIIIHIHFFSILTNEQITSYLKCIRTYCCTVVKYRIL